MRFRQSRLVGAFSVEIERLEDERGFFARLWCRREFASLGIDVEFVQSSLSANSTAGTVRGMHYQRPPGAEAKFLRCIKGAISDVIVDIRPKSPTFMQSEAFELTATNRRALFVPAGFAHGFQTLEDNTDVLYEMTDYFRSGEGAGFRYNDPAVSIEWPLPVSLINARDRTYPDLDLSVFDCFSGASIQELTGPVQR